MVFACPFWLYTTYNGKKSVSLLDTLSTYDFGL